MPSEKPYPKIGLALSGGAARGMAHTGVLRALLENDIRIDCIAATCISGLRRRSRRLDDDEKKSV